jgi:transposase-like protein
VVLKRRWAGEIRNVSVLVAIGIGTDGYRHILGIAEGEKEDLEDWRGFLRHLKDRGLKGVRLIISDAFRGLAAEVGPSNSAPVRNAQGADVAAKRAAVLGVI